MKQERPKAALNRALFVTRPLDSAAITTLVTVYHAFTEPGDYELFVRREGQLFARGLVQVAGGRPPEGGPDSRRTGAPYQVNLDLATFGQATDECEPATTCALATGGVMGFYSSGGTARYTVALTRITGDRKETVLDNAEGLPEGDFFAVTFLQPGVYAVTNRPADAQAKIEVNLPKEKGYRPDRATLVQAGRGGFDPGSVSLFSGQSVLFQCRVPSAFHVELVESFVADRRESGGERPRHTVSKRRPRPPAQNP